MNIKNILKGVTLGLALTALPFAAIAADSPMPNATGTTNTNMSTDRDSTLRNNTVPTTDRTMNRDMNRTDRMDRDMRNTDRAMDRDMRNNGRNIDTTGTTYNPTDTREMRGTPSDRYNQNNMNNMGMTPDSNTRNDNSSIPTDSGVGVGGSDSRRND